MIIRVYDTSAKFGEETLDYHDFECDTYEVDASVLRLMRFQGNDLYIPLASIKLFKKISGSYLDDIRAQDVAPQMGEKNEITNM